jgi:hypothetical protein
MYMQYAQGTILSSNKNTDKRKRRKSKNRNEQRHFVVFCDTKEKEKESSNRQKVYIYAVQPSEGMEIGRKRREKRNPTRQQEFMQ